MLRMRILWLALLSIPATTAHGDGLTSKMDALFAQWDKPDSPGVAVAVVKGGQMSFAKGYGMADLEHDVPITPKTAFHIASVTKSFTAFAVVRLAQEGKLTLDDDIRKHLPDLNDFGKIVTIRHLIHHTSGLREYQGLFVLRGGPEGDVIRQDEILRLLRDQRELNFPPGEEHLYSNSNYILLATIVERVTKRSYRDWMVKDVFEPLGMSGSEVGDDVGRDIKGRAVSYEPEPGEGAGFRALVVPITASGDGNIFSTAEDMARWLANFGRPRVGDAATIEQLYQPGKLLGAVPLSDAFGLVIGEHRGLRHIGQSGSWAGYRAYIVRFPDQDLGIVILSNHASSDPRGMAMKVADLALAESLTKPAEEDTGLTTKEPRSIKIDLARLDDFSGMYASEGDGNSVGFFRSFATCFRQGDHFFNRLLDDSRLEFFPMSESAFFTKGIPLRFTFHRDRAGKVTYQTVVFGDVPSETGGIGVSTARADEAGYAIVTALIPDKPAARDGRIRVGDRLIGIELEGGRLLDFRGRNPAGIPGLIGGPTGSKVRLVVAPEGQAGRSVFELTRAAFDLDVARRIEPYEPPAAELAAYAGRYFSSELETSYRLVVQDGKLVAKRQRGGDVILRPIQKDRFAGIPYALFPQEFQFDRARGDRIAGFRATTVGVRNLRFDRQPSSQ